ncbi:uncharacterized protein Z520_09523 [Fonsecaea multimorphosa CBS 102226]|uniref:Transcription initiation factor TFIID subunit 4 n=1 Tax=Fonsecaea multimorphosa CBS 102226 TaxID=1442371 RepID=A0A0D2KDQ2_9EURO|nr:uncharacterized protein Z520_09523 [Fonsecaea multimorphosa CBS 102226]KIX94833.1 hypothetical protein Z520_09523 [Fonsecaea multimorphosa CBS 102226]OAL20411.1 hypothetical protein AYO22_08905 [Fonsecaea multimorphosa]
MAHSPPAPSRPPLPQTQTSFSRNFSSANGRPSPLGPQSPPLAMNNYSSPSPQAFSPQQYFQPPAAKRPRLSPDVQSPSPAQSFPPTPTAQPTTPSGNAPVNGSAVPSTGQGLMPPPQRPPDKAEDRNYEDILVGTGINIEEEARMLVQNDYFGSSRTATTSSFEYQNNSFPRPGSSGGASAPQQEQGEELPQEHQPSEEEMKERNEARADWEASRYSQYPLWDMFLLGGALNEKIRNISITEHLVDPQSGVLVNTQKHMPPPTVRVNGLEGASRIIDKGQAILDTGQKGERLSDIMKVISLATRARMTGLLSASSRLAKERRQHSTGKVPEEWQDIAVQAKPATDVPDGAASPAASSSLKRTHSQANSDSPFRHEEIPGPIRLISTFEKVSQAERAAEEARRQKRAKRKAAKQEEAGATATETNATPEAATVANLDAEKKTTKKERKLAESKFSEQQQHKSANEAARMAVAGLFGSRLGGKKSRTYDWMNAGKAGGSPAATPGKPPASAAPSTAGTPAPDRARTIPKEKQFGNWDEDKDAKIQARDVLLVLESDGRASRSYVRGLSLPEKTDS